MIARSRWRRRGHVALLALVTVYCLFPIYFILVQSLKTAQEDVFGNPLIVRRAPPTIGTKHVYMSWGKGDSYTPRSTLDANARSLGLAPAGNVVDAFDVTPITRPVSANVTGSDDVPRTAAVAQYQPNGYDGHFVATKNDDAIADWSAFLTSYFTTGQPTIP